MATVPTGPIGIDLGTTNTCVCMKVKTSRKGEFKILENTLGNPTTPSYVAFTEDEEVVGRYAKEQACTNPKNTVFGSKRLLGRKRSEKCVKDYFDHVPFTVSADRKDDPIIEIERGDKKETYRPEEISARILGYTKEIVKTKTGKMPVDVVITVPAYFNDLQRRATKKAAEIAGLNVVLLANEPTAAAIAFQKETNFNHGKVLVYDFGGGTLDCSILEVEDDRFTVKSVSGDTALGGLDIDKMLADFAWNQFSKKNPGLKLEGNARARTLLLQDAERAKCSLSFSNEAVISVPTFINGIDLLVPIRRATLEGALIDIAERLEQPIEKALSGAKLSKEDITHIILVGGSSRIPFVKKTVQEYFENKIEPLSAVNPDEAVAVGAAIICDLLKSGKAFRDLSGKVKFIDSGAEEDDADDKVHFDDEEDDEEDGPAECGYITIVDTQPSTIGILDGKTAFKPFIIKDQPLPQSKSMRGQTTSNHQRNAKIRIYQGEDPIAANNIFLGEYKLEPLPDGKKGEVYFNVTLEVDASGILRVKAYCTTKESVSIDVNVNVKSVLDGPEMEEAVEKYKNNEKRNELIKEYKKELNTMQELILKLKRKKVDTKGWLTMFDNLSSSIPNEIDALNTAIKNIKLSISKLESILKA